MYADKKPHPGSRIHKRPLTRPPPRSKTSGSDGGSGNPSQFYLSSSASFMSVVQRVRKQLDHRARGPRGPSTKNLPLNARIAALRDGPLSSSAKDGKALEPSEQTDRRDDVLVLATGKAIEKALHVAAWFDRERDCRVSLRTRTTGTVDDVLPDEAAQARGEEEKARVRMVSVLEVGISLR